MAYGRIQRVTFLTAGEKAPSAEQIWSDPELLIPDRTGQLAVAGLVLDPDNPSGHMDFAIDEGDGLGVLYLRGVMAHVVQGPSMSFYRNQPSIVVAGDYQGPGSQLSLIRR